MHDLPPLSVFIIGVLPDEAERALAAPAGVTVEITRIKDAARAAAHLASGARAPELILIAAARDGEGSAAAIDALRRAAPLARIWRIAGNWCEGEKRSGRPPEGCLMSYAHQWPVRWGRELAALGEGAQPAWSLPLTASSEERLLALADRPLTCRSGQIAIVSQSSAAAAALADACRLFGYQPLAVREDRIWSAPDAVALIWDTDCYRMVDASRVARLRKFAGDAPLVALAGFPRKGDIRRAQGVGVAGVVSKPFLIHDLYWQLEQAIISNCQD